MLANGDENELGNIIIRATNSVEVIQLIVPLEPLRILHYVIVLVV